MSKGASSTGKLKQNALLYSILDEWEEPPEIKGNMTKTDTIEDMVRFNEILNYLLRSETPFSKAFGLADTRLHCAESSQNLYKDLPFQDVELGVLRFDALCNHLAKQDDGDLDEYLVRKLVKLFRPERDGTLLLVDFIRSIDEVYKNLQLLKASILNSSKVDSALEFMIHALFCAVIFVAILLVFQRNPLGALTPIITFVIPFSFVFGNAGSDWFKGVLLILVRDAYDVGDRIALSNPNDDTDGDGSTTWFVEYVGLYSTVVRLAGTNEVASLCNGSISSSRIINAARSPRACVYIRLKFDLNIPYKKIETFKEVIMKFVKERPREWASFNGFRAQSVEVDSNYIGYVIVLTHRQSWQYLSQILIDKAAVSCYCLEVTKKLGMTYTAPPMPVHLSAASSFLQNPAPDDDGLSMGSSVKGSGFDMISNMLNRE